MTNKTKFFVLIFLILLVAGILWQRNAQEKQKASVVPAKTADNSAQNSDVPGSSVSDEELAIQDQIEQDFNSQCENGEWVKIADAPGEMATIIGIAQPVDPEMDPASAPFKDYTNYINGNEKVALINVNVKSDSDINNIDLFQTREVEAQGVIKQQGAVKTMEVTQIRCAGKETDKNLAVSRAKTLNYISDNINALAPEKASPKQKWAVDSAIVLDEKDFYVDYYDTIEDTDNVDPDLDTVHRLLLEMSAKSKGGFEAKVLAYFVPGEEDFVLKSGIDKFKNQDETAFPLYSYDPEENSWTRE